VQSLYFFSTQPSHKNLALLPKRFTPHETGALHDVAEKGLFKTTARAPVEAEMFATAARRHALYNVSNEYIIKRLASFFTRHLRPASTSLTGDAAHSGNGTLVA